MTLQNEYVATAQPTLGAAKRPWFSAPQIVWYVVFAALIILNMFVPQGSFFFTVGLIALLVVGGVPLSTEGPLFMRVVITFRNWIWRFKHGVVYSRSLSETAKFFDEQGSRISAPFDVTLRGIPYTDVQGRDTQIGTFDTPDGRHCAMVLGSGWGEMAMSDPRDAAVYTNSLLASILDVAIRLQPGDRITLFKIRRESDSSEAAKNIKERVHEEVLEAEIGDGSAYDEKVNMFDGTAYIYRVGAKATTGVVINTSRPSYWKPRKLDHLSLQQVTGAPLIQAVTSLQSGMTVSGIEDVHLPDLYSLAGAIKEACSVGVELKEYRTLLAGDVARDAAGELESFWQADSLRIGPWPLKDVRIHRDHILFDGTYHRVMWAANFRPTTVHLGAFESVFRLPGNTMVSVSCTVRSSKASDISLQTVVDFRQTMLNLFRSEDLVASPKKRQQFEDVQQAWEAFHANGALELDMRLLVITSATSLEKLDDQEALVRDQLSALRLVMQTVHGELDQLYWFIAALGMKHE